MNGHIHPPQPSCGEVFNLSPPLSLTAIARTDKPWAWYHLAGPSRRVIPCRTTHGAKRRDKKQVALHVCLLALHALRTATCRRPRRGGEREGKRSHIRCYLGSEDNKGKKPAHRGQKCWSCTS